MSKKCQCSPWRQEMAEGHCITSVGRHWLGMRQRRSCRQLPLPVHRHGSSVRAGSCTGPSRSSSGGSQKNKKACLRPNRPRSLLKGRLTRTTVSVSYPRPLPRTRLILLNNLIFLSFVLRISNLAPACPGQGRYRPFNWKS